MNDRIEKSRSISNLFIIIIILLIIACVTLVFTDILIKVHISRNFSNHAEFELFYFSKTLGFKDTSFLPWLKRSGSNNNEAYNSLCKKTIDHK